MSGRRLLIVDDELTVLQLLKRFLERSGYEVQITANAEEALRIFEAEPEGFDLVITDLTLPGLSGEELLKQMRARNPVQRALISSGYQHRPELPGVGFLLKPYLPKMLVEEIDRILGPAGLPR